jgi:hypothetical protein
MPPARSANRMNFVRLADESKGLIPPLNRLRSVSEREDLVVFNQWRDSDPPLIDSDS